MLARPYLALDDRDTLRKWGFWPARAFETALRR